jgi:hypothetical protein
MKAFEDVWHDIQILLKSRQQVQTLCQRSVNDVIEVSIDGVRVSSRRSKVGKVRFISKSDFQYVWKILSAEGVYTLQNLTKIIGRRSITCAILARLPYVIGECDKGRVSLKLKE